MGVDLTTLKRVKLLLDYDLTKTANDNTLKRVISSVSAQAERFLNRHILKTSRTETYDSEIGQDTFILKGYPVDSVTSIKSDASRDFSNAEAISSDTYNLQDSTGLLVFDSYLPSYGPGTLQVVYTGGMASSVASATIGIGTITGTITVGNYVKGNTSGARGELTASATGSLTVSVLSGFFSSGETVEDETSGGTATISAITTEPLCMAFPEVCAAVEAQCVYEYKRKDEVGLTSFSAEGGSISLQTPASIGLRPGVKDMLRPYRRLPGRGP